MKMRKTYDFFALKPPPEVFQMKLLPCQIIKIVNEKKTRLIFSSLDYDSDEKSSIDTIKDLINDWNSTILSKMSVDDDLILRYLYATDFDNQKCMKRLKEYLIWKEMTEKFEPNPKIIELLNSGLLYQLGRDNMYRPIIIFNLSKLDKINDFSNCKKAITYFLTIIEKYMFFPSLIEKWVILIDCRDFPKGMSFTSDDLLYLLSDLAEHFIFTLEKLYIIEPTYEILTFLQGLKGKIDAVTMDRIMVIESKNLRAVLLRGMNADQIEQKYGGSLSNKRIYWPPKTTYSDTNYSLSPSRNTSRDFHSAKSSISDKVSHYSVSVVSNSNDYFFELNQKDYFYKTGELVDDNDNAEITNAKAQSCFGPCFGPVNRTTIIDLQENPKPKPSCHIF